MPVFSIISRAKVAHAPGIGAAFLALARGDSAQASRAFGFHQAMDHAGAVVGPLLGAAGGQASTHAR